MHYHSRPIKAKTTKTDCLMQKVDVWREYDPRTSSFDVCVARQHADAARSVLEKHGYDVTVMIHDVGK